jgi:predicted NBD/HSP70 family sugar kinase
LVAGAGTVAAVEVTAHTVRAALVDARGHVDARVSVALVDQADPAAIDSAIAGAVAALDPTQPLLGLGISVPGTCDVTAGAVLNSVHLPGAVGTRLATVAAQTTGLPVRIENNTRATALAEQWFGQGRGLGTFATIQTGDGLGAGIVLAGAVHRGPRGFGGEIGHTAVVVDGERCRCGRTGCWETIATLGWLRRAAEAGGLPDAGHLDAARLAALAGADGAADALLDRYADHLAVGIANLHGTLGIDRFILHGDAVGGGAPFAQRISTATTRRTGSHVGVVVTVSELADATLLGAAGVVLTDLLHTVNPS